jgi:DNA-binding SARP family transcriptional activator
MTQAQLTLLGDFRLTISSPAVVPHTWGPERLPLLLAYLAVHADRFLDRAHVAFCLWPDETESQALARLRQQIHQIRTLFADHGLPPDLLQSQGGRIRLHGQGPLTLDAWRFQELAEHPEGWPQAVQLYRGDLLSPLGDLDWILPLRARLRDQALQILVALAQEARRRGEPRQALVHTQRLLDLDPCCEAFHRLHMEALTAAGRRLDALRHYEQFCQRLAESWHTEPGPALAELAQALRAGQPISSLAPAPQVSLPATPPASLRLVGRSREWAEMERALATTRRGHGAALVIAGENGLGRTYLVESWLGQIEGDVRRVQIHCRPEQPAPFLWRQALDTLLPGSNAISSELYPRLQVRQAARQILAWVRHHAIPLVWVVKDLHHGDPDTWEAWAYLAARCRDVPLLLLATLAPAVLGEEARCQLRMLRRRGYVRMCSLRPLTLAETAELVRCYLDISPPPSLVQALHRVSEGHPYFAVAYLQAMSPEDVAQGRLPPMPGPVRQVLAEAWASLSPAGRTVLQAAVALPSPFDLADLIQATPHLDDPARMEGLEQCLRRGLLQETGGGYRVAHNQIRVLMQEGEHGQGLG